MDTINERFRYLRKSLGLSQEEFAAKAHRTRSEITNIEYGKTTPKDAVISSICATYGIREEWLLTGEGEMKAPKTREEEIAELVEQSPNGSSEFKISLIKMICSLTDAELESLKSVLRKIYEGI